MSLMFILVLATILCGVLYVVCHGRVTNDKICDLLKSMFFCLFLMLTYVLFSPLVGHNYLK